MLVNSHSFLVPVRRPTSIQKFHQPVQQTLPLVLWCCRHQAHKTHAHHVQIWLCIRLFNSCLSGDVGKSTPEKTPWCCVLSVEVFAALPHDFANNEGAPDSVFGIETKQNYHTTFSSLASSEFWGLNSLQSSLCCCWIHSWPWVICLLPATPCVEPFASFASSIYDFIPLRKFHALFPATP